MKGTKTREKLRERYISGELTILFNIQLNVNVRNISGVTDVGAKTI